MNSVYLGICNKINKPWSNPIMFGMCGGVIATLGQNITGNILYQAIYWTIGYKLALIMTGVGIGWNIGNKYYDPDSAIDELIKNPNIWGLIIESYVSDDCYMIFKKSTAIEVLLNTRLDIGKLYQFLI